MSRRPRPTHPIMRAADRYGLDLTPADLWAITKRIQNNDETEFEAKLADGATIWRLTYAQTPVRIIVDKTFYFVLTFLPMWPKKERVHRIVQRSKRVYSGGRARYVKDQVWT